MRVISCNLQNFASYKQLSFNFNDRGLTLIQGPTGSGKSTLCDAIPWLVFGRTSKNGEVSEVLSWPGDKVTKGALHVEVKGEPYIIHRSRGPKTKDNDLYYQVVGLEDGIKRGKDLNDTQKLINNILGMDIDLYLAGAYYHEFSQTAQFFTTTAKNRRVLCEQVVDLKLVKNLHIKLSEAYKVVSKSLLDSCTQIQLLKSKVETLSKVQTTEDNRAAAWEVTQDTTKDYTIQQYERFEANRKKIITNKCNTCGTPLSEPREVIDESTNPYLERLAELETQANPHTNSVKDYSIEIQDMKNKLVILEGTYEALVLELDDISLLQQVTTDYRSVSVTNTIQSIENSTNKLLSDHFDAEIRVEFTIEDDKLDVNITKDGNLASYTQLSKGQRQLLKLCFGVAIMDAVSNHHGIQFNAVFLDEALDGCDDVVKAKAFKLLEELSQNHESVFVVEHSSEIKAMFTNSYSVELNNGGSQIEKA